MESETRKNLRCAIYTRKSTSEGLDKDFTTLDAQRESGINYIKSQKSEGWSAIPEKYDDGGFTGANMDRPAIQKLISDIKLNKIDCVVVYKVDRLSRSLMDFAKLLEFFEQYNVTFVSVTQHFNTNTSMGRLTLNILLSFAQFEREMISERTRDKMAAVKKKGRWMGGHPVLGYSYDKEKRLLLVNKKESELVKQIFNLYIEQRSFLKVAGILNQKGIKPKQHKLKSGKLYGNDKYKNTHIQYIISNPLYIGKIKHKDMLYQGLHDAIISEQLFNKAREIISENRPKRDSNKNIKNVGLLSKLLHCKNCNSIMVHTYSSKKSNRKYRYYVCMNAQKRGYHTCPTRSLSAVAIEEAVINCLKEIAGNSSLQYEKIKSLKESLENQKKKLSNEQLALESKISDLFKHIEDISSKDTNNATINHRLSHLKDDLKEAEQSLSKIKIKQANIEDRLIDQNDFQQAMVITSPIWDTLFLAEKKRILDFLLKGVDYDSITHVLGLTFNENGIKLLKAELNK